MNRIKRGKLLSVLGALGLVLVLSGCSPQFLVLHPQGPVASEELHLIYLSAILCLIVIVPVLILLGVFVVRYRDKEGNKAPYKPEWSESKVLEFIWWGVPIIIIGILGTATARGTFKLTKPPENNVKPITVQVISLDWKWLFQYPGQGVATVNKAVIPTGVPIQFQLTSDAPMNSFWVPQLGGQEFTMPGMAMRLWLQADNPGNYYGHGANFTGRGFAFMNFTVKAESLSQFDSWVKKVKSTSPALTMGGWDKLKKPGITNVAYYSSFPKNLFNNTIWADGGRYMSGMLGSGSMKMSSPGTVNNVSSGSAEMLPKTSGSSKKGVTTKS